VYAWNISTDSPLVTPEYTVYNLYLTAEVCAFHNPVLENFFSAIAMVLRRVEVVLCIGAHRFSVFVPSLVGVVDSE
jgi:hypothetical protein